MTLFLPLVGGIVVGYIVLGIQLPLRNFLKKVIGAARVWWRQPCVPWPALSRASLSYFEARLAWSGYVKRKKWLAGIWLISFIGGAVSFFIGWSGGVFGGVIFIGGSLGYIFITAAYNKKKFRRELPDALAAIVDALRAGYSLPQVFTFMARELEPPLKDIFLALERSHFYHFPFLEALERLSRQLNIPDWIMVAEVLATQQQVGGNSIPLLEETIRTLRDQQAIEREIQTMTAAGRLSGWIIACLGPIVVIFFWLISPAYIGILFTNNFGRFLIIIAGLLELVGLLWIRHIIRIEY